MYNFCFVLVIAFFGFQIDGQTQPNPCPDRFRYLPGATFNSWSGELLVTSDVDLIDGVFIVVIFDKPIKKLGSTFGKQIVKRNDTEYLLRNFGYQLEKNKLLTIRIDVEFENWSDPPNFAGYRLNAINWCPNTKKNPQSSVPTNNRFPDFYYQYLNNRPSNNFAVSPPPINAISNQNRFPECGVPKEGSVTNNGRNISPGEFPWHAAIFVEDPPRFNLVCGGTLISEQYVLTSASCLYPVLNKHIVVNLGSSQIFDFSSATQRIRAQSIAGHPQFNPDIRLKNDMAIIYLAEKAKITDSVKLACLWSRSDDLTPNLVGVAPGFGLIDPKKTASTLKKTYLPLIPREKCHRSEIQNSFCAGSPNGTLPCQLDPGSGLVIKKQLDSTRYVFEVRGVVASGLPDYGNCDISNIAVFTDVAKYIDWIISTINPK